VDPAVELLDVLRAPGQIGDRVQRRLGLGRRRLSLDLGLERGDAALQGRIGRLLLVRRDAGSSLGEAAQLAG
jgi:hypothetical protein